VPAIAGSARSAKVEHVFRVMKCRLATAKCANAASPRTERKCSTPSPVKLGRCRNLRQRPVLTDIGAWLDADEAGSPRQTRQTQGIEEQIVAVASPRNQIFQ
jgi:hypothetical protein